MTRITVEEAAELLNMPPQAVRTMIRSGALPIGVCRESKKRNTYYIFKEKIIEWQKGETNARLY